MPEQLWETTLNPATRTLRKLTIEDAGRFSAARFQRRSCGDLMPGLLYAWHDVLWMAAFLHCSRWCQQCLRSCRPCCSRGIPHVCAADGRQGGAAPGAHRAARQPAGAGRAGHLDASGSAPASAAGADSAVLAAGLAQPYCCVCGSSCCNQHASRCTFPDPPPYSMTHSFPTTPLL